MAKSDLERQFLEVWWRMCAYHEVEFPDPVRELQFHPTRRWRFDFAWPTVNVAVEIDGGSWIGGRHSTGLGMQQDHEKHNAAVVCGWKVLRYTGAMLRRQHDVFEEICHAMGALDHVEQSDW